MELNIQYGWWTIWIQIMNKWWWSNHEQYEFNMKGFFEDWCDLTWYWTWLLLLMIIFMSFCLDLDHVVGFVDVVGQHWRASFKSFSFIEWTQDQVYLHFSLTWTFVFLFWNMNLIWKITSSMEFTLSFFLWPAKT